MIRTRIARGVRRLLVDPFVPQGAHAGRPRLKNRAMVTGSIVATFAVVGAASVSLVAAPALAASLGPGYDDLGVLSNLGAFVAPDGSYVYCVDPGASSPYGGATTDGGSVVSVNGAGSLAMSQANYIISKYGETPGANNQAAAVEMTVWTLLSNAEYQAEGGDSYIITRAPADQRAAILALANQYRAAAAAYSPTAAAGGSNSGSLTFSVDNNNYTGTMTVHTSPVSARGTIKLTNGKFTATGSSTSGTVTNGSKLAVQGIPPANAASYEISGTGSFTAGSSVTNYDGNGHLWNTAGSQRLLGPGTTSSPRATFTVSGHDPFDRSTIFTPVVSTKVASAIVQPNGVANDTITASVTSATPWYKTTSGAYLSIIAKGTLYGPFAAPQTQSATIPAGAPVVGTDTITLKGPDTYTTPGDLRTTQGGYYNWVWRINSSDQGAVAKQLLPANYAFQDAFGQPDETSATPLTVTGSTRVTAPQTGLSASARDTVTVASSNGPWISGANGPVPVTLNGTAYFVSGDTAPAASATAPAGTRVLGTASLTFTDAGTQTSTPVTVPDATAGYVIWVWHTATAANVVPWTDTFAVPAETAQVLAPTLTTNALPTTVITDTAHDTATVGGTLPATPSDLTFAAYQQPVGYTVPVCDATTQVFDTTSTPVTVSATGDFASATYTTAKKGDVVWIATLTSSAGNVIAQGSCTDTTEVTKVTAPTITTYATAAAATGDHAHDTATVAGPIPATPGTLELTFDAYLQPAGSTTAICDATTQVFTTDDTPVTATGTGDFPSADYTTKAPGNLDWVATLSTSDGYVVDQGTCGDTAEITNVGATAVNTAAVSHVIYGTAAHDMATISGNSPIGGYFVWTAYNQATVTATPVCTPDNKVAGTGTQKVKVADTVLGSEPAQTAAPGAAPTATPTDSVPTAKYRGPEMTFADVGAYDWVAVLFNAQDQPINTGRCGDPAERTMVLAASNGGNGAGAAAVLAFTGSNLGYSPWIAAGIILAGVAAVLLNQGRRRRQIAYGPLRKGNGQH